MAWFSVRSFLSAGLKRFQSVRSSSTQKAVAERFTLPQKYQNLTYNVWLDFAKLAEKHKPIHLGQGFPDFLPPKFVIKNLQEVAKSECYLTHQYARMFGQMSLVRALAKMYSNIIDREISPTEEILISSGAYGSINAVMNAFLEKGDEVILIEPYYESYRGFVELAGGRCKNIPLRLPTKEICDGPIPACLFALDPDELKNAFTKKTKIFLLNNPHNPTGKIFTEDEIKEIFELCEKWNVLLVSDEVYEWTVYPGKEFIKTMSIPGTWDRTIAIGSGGKKFVATGWKTGWAYGPRGLIKQMMETQAHTMNSFVTPIQEALALNIKREIDHWDDEDASRKVLGKLLQQNSKMVGKGLTEAGLRPVAPDAGQYIIADWTEYGKNVKGWEEYPDDGCNDVKFTKWLTANHKLLTIPLSAFHYDFKNLGEKYIRINILKGHESLNKGMEILKAAGTAGQKCDDDDNNERDDDDDID